YPIVLAQVDQSNLTKVFQVDPKRHLVRTGTISPEDRQVSTIAQFRAIDYGMENCQLHISVPTSASELVMQPEQSFSLSVHQLDTSTPLNVVALSYYSKPRRVANVGDIHVKFGYPTFWHTNFTCKSEELLAFELSCSTSIVENPCSIGWWQSKENPGTGK
ncbi:uncharacterized protein FOMMEDRAFT_71127, partial [Fomitiporia mediterranea MF3/22]|uniref:uncharacterized protein n=1 Tax=Fomitiporia mediterranea (strain MF3/22) TaxID=694068 RepID=UPI00044090E6